MSVEEKGFVSLTEEGKKVKTLFFVLASLAQKKLKKKKKSFCKVPINFSSCN